MRGVEKTVEGLQPPSPLLLRLWLKEYQGDGIKFDSSKHWLPVLLFQLLEIS